MTKDMKKKNTIDSILEQIPEPIYHYEDASLLSEADYYGASRLVAEKLGLSDVPFSFAGWRHGWMHVPLKYVQQLTVWGKKDSHFLTAQEDHAYFLKQHGISATAVGMPFIYAEAIDNSLRIPNTLLVMPQHTLPYVPNVGEEEKYVQDIEKIRHDFDAVVFCIHHSCYEHGIWPALLKKYKFPMIIGASATQTNAITRLQKVFSIFEFVTTNTIGSHLPYAAYCGVKVSIYGNYSDFSKYDFSNDPFAKANPELIDFDIKHSTEVYVRNLLPFIFCKHPRDAKESKSWADVELGVKNKKSAQELAELLGWNDLIFQKHMRIAKTKKKEDKLKENLFDDILSMLTLAKKYRNNFAIYGAGNIGKKILRILHIYDLRPICIFDREYHSIQNISDIPVKNPHDIFGQNLDAIIIASFAHSEDIDSYINEIDSRVVTWKTK